MGYVPGQRARHHLHTATSLLLYPPLHEIRDACWTRAPCRGGGGGGGGGDPVCPAIRACARGWGRVGSGLGKVPPTKKEKPPPPAPAPPTRACCGLRRRARPPSPLSLPRRPGAVCRGRGSRALQRPARVGRVVVVWGRAGRPAAPPGHLGPSPCSSPLSPTPLPPLFLPPHPPSSRRWGGRARVRPSEWPAPHPLSPSPVAPGGSPSRHQWRPARRGSEPS